MRQELLDRNVAQLVQIPKQRKRKLVPWTSEEARRFLESARSDSDPLYAAYVLVLVLGLRKGEVLGLAWDSVNFFDLHGRYGTAIDPRTLNRKFVARCEAAGVRPITVHDARHTCATLLVDLDVHPRVIMRILRHADQAVTMEIYANASSAATREALRRLGDILD